MAIIGKNTEITHGNMRYHIQTEVWDLDKKQIITQVFSSGKVVFKKITQDINKDLDEAEIEKAHLNAIKDFQELLI